MKFILQVILIALLAYLFELFLPWWSVAIAAFIGGIVLNTRANFFAGFLAIALLWAIAALVIEVGAAAPLTERVAKIFSLPKPALFAVTSILGALVGGFACMTGGALRQQKRKSYY
jgi:hypothetical protein